MSYNDDIADTISYEYLDNLAEQVEVHSIITSKRLKFLDLTATSVLLAISTTSYRHFPNGEFPDEEPTEVAIINTAIKQAGVLNAANILKMNKVYSFIVPQVTEDIQNTTVEGGTWSRYEYDRSTAKMLFTGNVTEGGNVTVTTKVVESNGTYSEDDNVMQWNINSKGHLEILGSLNYDYAIVRENAGNNPYVNVIATDERKAISGNTLLKDDYEWTEQSAPGIYNLDRRFGSLNNYFWVEVNADGTAVTIIVQDFNLNGTIESHEAIQYPGFWRIDNNGNLVIRRYRINQTYGSTVICEATEWDPADDAQCVLYHEREWNLHSITTDGKYYMNHMHRFYNDIVRDSLIGPATTGHVLGYAFSDNRYWKKLEQRPIELPTLIQKNSIEPLTALD